MKKITALILCLALALCLSACGSKPAAPAAAPVATEAPAAPAPAAEPAAEPAAAEADKAAEPSAAAEELIELPVVIENNTGADIHQLYASSANLEEWGEDILGETYLADGDSVETVFYIGADDLKWDLLMADSEGNEVELYGLDFTECSLNGGTVVLEYDAEEGTGSASLYSE